MKETPGLTKTIMMPLDYGFHCQYIISHQFLCRYIHYHRKTHRDCLFDSLFLFKVCPMSEFGLSRPGPHIRCSTVVQVNDCQQRDWHRLHRQSQPIPIARVRRYPSKKKAIKYILSESKCTEMMRACQYGQNRG